MQFNTSDKSTQVYDKDNIDNIDYDTESLIINVNYNNYLYGNDQTDHIDNFHKNRIRSINSINSSLINMNSINNSLEISECNEEIKYFFLILYGLFLFFLPVGDLIMSYYKISCQNIVTPIGISFLVWLKSYGLLMISLLSVIAISNSVCFIGVIDSNKICKFIGILYCFSFPWLVIGSVIYWKYAEPNGDCDLNVENYISTRLVFGIILNIIAIGANIYYLII